MATTASSVPNLAGPLQDTTISESVASSNSNVEQQQQQGPSYHDVICSHLYHNGFLQGLYADLTVRIFLQPAKDHLLQQHQYGSIPQPSSTTNSNAMMFKLHRIIAIRSPTLAQLLTNEQNAAMLTISVSDPNITPEGLGIAFGHLYAAYSHSLLNDGKEGMSRSVLLRSVFAAAHMLGLPDLQSLCFDHIKQDLNAASVLGYCLFVGNECSNVSFESVRDACVNFLHSGVHSELTDKHGPVWISKESESYRQMVALFADLPFEWLKRIVESKRFQVPSDLERFAFAKEVLQQRAKMRSTGTTSLIMAGEENVLLAFGGGKSGSSGVTIVRKVPKNSFNYDNRTSNAASQQRVANIQPSYSLGNQERRVWKAGH